MIEGASGTPASGRRGEPPSARRLGPRDAGVKRDRVLVLIVSESAEAFDLRGHVTVRPWFPRTTGDLPDAPADRTLPQLLARNAREYPRLPGLSRQSAEPAGDWETYSWAEIHEHTRSLAAGYRALGVGRGNRVPLMMSNRAWRSLGRPLRNRPVLR